MELSALYKLLSLLLMLRAALYMLSFAPSSASISISLSQTMKPLPLCPITSWSFFCFDLLLQSNDVFLILLFSLN